MSVAEILAELPRLDPAELELVFERTLELQKDAVFTASPELLRAIKEADEASEDGDVDIAEARRIVDSWNSK